MPPTEPVPAYNPPEIPPNRVESPKFGAYGTLLGPNSIIGLGVAVQPVSVLEVGLWYGYQGVSANESTGAATATASIKLNTVMARGRLWLMPRHSLVIEGGLGVSSYSISADGSDVFGNSLSYTRTGLPPVAMLGLAYGFRTAGGFRLTVGGGALLHGSKLGNSTVTSTGSFSAGDRESLRSSIDDTVDALTRPRAYLDLSIGFML